MSQTNFPKVEIVKPKALRISLLNRNFWTEVISSFVILLFMYAAVSKLLEYEVFKLQLSKSPFITNFATFVSYSLPILEIVIAVLMAIRKTRLMALYGSFFLMVIFTAYIYSMLLLSIDLPCSCGGIISKLGWHEHLYFNIIVTMLNWVGIYWESKEKNIPNRTFFKATSLLFAIGIISILVLSLLSFQNMYSKELFKRVHNINGVSVLYELKKTDDIEEVSGFDSNHLYFKTSFPGRILQTDYQLKTPIIKQYKSPVNDLIASHFYTFVDSSNVDILAGNVPAVILSSANEGPKYFKFPKKLFTRVTKISNKSYVFRGLDDSLKGNRQIFLKGHPTDTIMVKNRTLIEEAADGGISTDGLLNYDNKTHLLTYIFFDRNQFLTIDTNLNLINTFSTISNKSNEIIDVKVINSNSNNEKIMANQRPDQTINQLSTTYNGKLFNVSSIIASNESFSDFRDNSVIDVYDIKTGKYEQSFFIPKVKYEKMQSFKVIDSQIIVVYKSRVIIFSNPVS